MRRFVWGIIGATLVLSGAAVAFERSVTADRLLRDFPKATAHAGTGTVRWEVETLRVAFAVESAREDVLSGTMNAPWIALRDAVQSQTDLTLEIGTWADTEPRPQIYVMAADKARLVDMGPQLERDFDAAPFAETLQKAHASGEALCHSFASFDATGVLDYALVTVDLDADPAYCFKRQGLIAMGLAGDLGGLSNSILAGPLRATEITTLDQGLLAMLYDPRIAPGQETDTATLRQVAADVAASLAAE